MNQQMLQTLLEWLFIFGLFGGGAVLYTIRSMHAKVQDRKIKEAESRVKVAQLELEKERERNKPKFYTAQDFEQDHTYSQGLQEQHLRME